jgi:nucleotide-binding universal stress UspA family protein
MSQSLNFANKSMEGCVMLALSTFRRSEEAIDIAIEKSRKVKKLIIAYVADVNLARYLVDVEYGFIPGLKNMCERDLLKEHEKIGQEHVAAIRKRAEKEGIDVKRHVQVGRFGVVCLEVVHKEKPFPFRGERPGGVDDQMDRVPRQSIAD